MAHIPASQSVNASNVLSIIMGGGQGKRLFPLTKERAKPAVPLAGKYRLVDIPISNCINSGLRRIYLLTQFNSASLHRHVSQSYKFDHFTGGFVEILAAESELAHWRKKAVRARDRLARVQPIDIGAPALELLAAFITRTA